MPSALLCWCGQFQDTKNLAASGIVNKRSAVASWAVFPQCTTLCWRPSVQASGTKAVTAEWIQLDLLLRLVFSCRCVRKKPEAQLRQQNFDCQKKQALQYSVLANCNAARVWLWRLLQSEAGVFRTLVVASLRYSSLTFKTSLMGCLSNDAWKYRKISPRI